MSAKLPSPSHAAFATSRPAAVIATDGTFLACSSPPSQGIRITSLRAPAAAPLDLCGAGHERAITALCVSSVAVEGDGEEDDPEDESLLFSASRDAILLWRIHDLYAQGAAGRALEPAAWLSEGQGTVEALAVNPSATLVAACTTHAVQLLEVPSGECVCQLEGHGGSVTAVRFCLHSATTLITASEDRTFKVWDLAAGALVHSSSVLCAAALTSLALDPSFPRVAIGAADGVVRLFDISTPACRQVQLLDVAALTEKRAAQIAGERDVKPQGPKVISALPSWKASPARSDLASATADPPSPGPSALTGAAVVALEYSSLTRALTEGPAQSVTPCAEPGAPWSPLALQSPHLYVGLPSALAVLDTHTYELIDMLHYQLPPAAESPHAPLHPALADIATARCYAFGQGECVSGPDDEDEFAHLALRPAFHACVASAFSSTVSVLSWQHRAQEAGGEEGGGSGEGDGEEDGEGELSVFPLGPLPAGSPLLRGDPSAAPAKPKPSALRDRPVTFHTKIKSSGYGADRPVMRLGVGDSALAKLCRTYPTDSAAPTVLQAKHELPNGAAHHSAPILRLCYSGDGARLGTASVDKTARVVRLPVAKHGGDGTDLIAHTAAVKDLSWSHDNSLLLTAGADRAAYLWSAGKAEPLLALTHTERRFSAACPKPNPAFLSEVSAACFLYLDRFIVLASGAKVYLYRYSVSVDEKNDLKRLENNSKYRLLGAYTSSSQGITGLACANGFLSNVCLCAGSRRSVEVLDLAVGRWVRSFEDAHPRPAHTIALHQASRYASHPQQAYELFATAASGSEGGAVKLWDLRAQRSVHQFTGHANRQHTVGVAFSPCLRYLATGGEDKCAVLYDLRQGVLLHRLRQGHTDVVSDVAFHPMHPQVATACFDGRVRFFSDTG